MKKGFLINKKVIALGLSVSLLLGSLGNINCFAAGGEFNETQERNSNPSIISFTVDHEAPLRGLQEHEASNTPNLLQGAGVQRNEIADVSIGHFIYNIVRRAYWDTTGEVSITGVTGEGRDAIRDSGRLEIPREVTIRGKRYIVRSIGEWAFNCCTSLRRITIPNSVTSIGMFAFMFCTNLNNITIPNSVRSIGDWAFLGCTSLITITIPDSVTSICCGAFEDCESLNNITIPNSVRSIGTAVFGGCTSLERIEIPNGVRRIGDRAFKACKSLNNITIPNSVRSIGDGAFSGCTSLRRITIPDSVRSIGEYAFSGCKSLRKVTFSGDTIPQHTPRNAFANCRALELTFPSGRGLFIANEGI